MKTRLSFLVVFWLLCSFGPVQAGADEGICGGVPQAAVWDGTLLRTHSAVRSEYYDSDSGLLWFGGLEGGVSVYNTVDETLETCVDDGHPVGDGHPVNDITVWNASVWAVSDGAGALEFPLGVENALWIKHTYATGDLPDTGDRAYCAVPNLTAHKLEICTWGGVAQVNLAGEWEDFPNQPPDGVVNYHTLIQRGSRDWLFGAINDGVYRFIDGTWEKFSTNGIQRWDADAAVWFQPFRLSGFDDHVRDLKLMTDGRLAIVSDEEVASGLVFLSLGSLENRSGYDVQVVDDAEGFELVHLNAVAFGLSDFMVVANSSETEGTGAYLSIGSGNLSQITDLRSFDVSIAHNRDIYVATDQGILHVQLLLP